MPLTLVHTYAVNVSRRSVRSPSCVELSVLESSAHTSKVRFTLKVGARSDSVGVATFRVASMGISALQVRPMPIAHTRVAYVLNRSALGAGVLARATLGAGVLARAMLGAGVLARAALSDGMLVRATLRAGALDQATLGAGVLARAALSAEVLARATLTTEVLVRAVLSAGVLAWCALWSAEVLVHDVGRPRRIVSSFFVALANLSDLRTPYGNGGGIIHARPLLHTRSQGKARRGGEEATQHAHKYVIRDTYFISNMCFQNNDFFFYNF